MPKRPPPVGSAAERLKRPKPTLACASCRKHKTRCEPPIEPGTTRCHRCKVLDLSCTLESAPPRAPAAGSSSSGSNVNLRSGDANSDVVLTAAESAAAGSPQSALRANSPPPFFFAHVLTTEDIVFLPSSSCYFVERNPAGADWTILPMTAMYELLRRGRGRAMSSATPDATSGDDNLNEDEVKYLLNLFDVHYVPWLNMPPLRTSRPTNSPPSLDDFLTLARCAIAMRHMPAARAAACHLHMQKAAEHAVLLHMFDPYQYKSLEALQALLIFSLWFPAVGSSNPQILDGALIASAAVKMGRYLKLDTASEQVAALKGRADAGEMSVEERHEYEDLLFKAKLWCTACNAEWLLCAGTARVPASLRSPADMKLTDWRVYPGADTEQDARDFRLSITTFMLEATRRAITLKFTTVADFSSVLDEVCHTLEGRRNIIMSTIQTGEQEILQMKGLLLLQHCCRLLVYLYGLCVLRKIVEGHRKEKAWLKEITRSGVSCVRRWIPGFVSAAQSTIIEFLEIAALYKPAPASADAPPPLHPLSCAPDYVHAALLFGASSLLVARYTKFTQHRTLEPIYFHLPGRLLARLAHTLDALAVPACDGTDFNHTACRCARVVRELGRVWEVKVRAVLAGAGTGAGGMRPGAPTEDEVDYDIAPLTAAGQGPGAPFRDNGHGFFGGAQPGPVPAKCPAAPKPQQLPPQGQPQRASAVGSQAGDAGGIAEGLSGLDLMAAAAASASASVSASASAAQPLHTPGLGLEYGSSGMLEPDLVPAEDLGLLQFFGQDEFLDREFWTLFMDNVAAP